MQIINLNEAILNGRTSSGLIYVNSDPQVRPGRKDYILGDLMYKGKVVQFRSWDDDVLEILRAHGKGIYRADTLGQEYKSFSYINIRSIDLYVDNSVSEEDFQDCIPQEELESKWTEALEQLQARGLSDACRKLIDDVVNDPELEGRFFTEGAAIKHHDNLIGGLWNHSSKMLRILIALLDNNKELLPSVDLMTFSVVAHDIGKVFEYDALSMSEHWYANHRVRGIEFLVKYRERIIDSYSEQFYRQVQAVIAGHHGEYGDRPTTVAAVIVHYIDSLESQATELLREQEAAMESKFFSTGFGYLESICPDDLD
ncbi:MAG TPA: HD domain-containing protein [Fastidiosipila sp.]|nr:HD domain-containing protein [Fastidiosipila sp.]